MRDPVCPLVPSPYGHPDAGGHWEAHCDAIVRKAGFEPDAQESWRSCYRHPEYKMFLVIYVDDFKMAGPAGNLQRGWEVIAKGLKIEPPGPLGLYLGCKHEESS